MQCTGLIGRDREFDEIVTVAGDQSPFFGCGVRKLLPIVEIPTAYFMNTHHVEIMGAGNFRHGRIDVFIQEK